MVSQRNVFLQERKRKEEEEQTRLALAEELANIYLTQSDKSSSSKAKSILREKIAFCSTLDTETLKDLLGEQHELLEQDSDEESEVSVDRNKLALLTQSGKQRYRMSSSNSSSSSSSSSATTTRPDPFLARHPKEDDEENFQRRDLYRLILEASPASKLLCTIRYTIDELVEEYQLLTNGRPPYIKPVYIPPAPPVVEEPEVPAPGTTEQQEQPPIVTETQIGTFPAPFPTTTTAAVVATTKAGTGNDKKTNRPQPLVSSNKRQKIETDGSTGAAAQVSNASGPKGRITDTKHPAYHITKNQSSSSSADVIVLTDDISGDPEYDNDEEYEELPNKRKRKGKGAKGQTPVKKGRGSRSARKDTKSKELGPTRIAKTNACQHIMNILDAESEKHLFMLSRDFIGFGRSQKDLCELCKTDLRTLDGRTSWVCKGCSLPLTGKLHYVCPSHAMEHAFCFAKEAYFGAFYKYLQGEQELQGEQQEEEEEEEEDVEEEEEDINV